MKYKTKKFIDFLGGNHNGFHIYVKIDDRKKYKVAAMPARNEKFVKRWDGEVQLYISVNPCQMMTRKPKISDVVMWTCEYIDLDCERPDHSVPATTIELTGLMVEVERINNWLEIEGFLPGYQDFTGNGYRWLLPIPPLDLRKLSVKDVLKLNEQKHEWLRIMKRETGTNVDTTVGELSRITGVPGTMNVKARDDRDRRREPFRGCVRVEDPALRDYVMGLEIPEEEYTTEIANWSGNGGQILEAIISIDKTTKTLIERAALIKSGHRSEYDYAIARKMKEWKVSMGDCMDILGGFGTVKARKSKEYVKLTVRKVYLSV